ncbi:MAG TPA: Hpt domain-containing protein, partial [Cellvibrio sp.]|nr:Hpt domain-containing protein [Cellvibrio sp.]
MDTKQWQLLKNDYVRRLRTYLAELTLFELEFFQPLASEQLRNIENLVHRLAGSGAAYGFTELSVKAKTLELLLQGLQNDVSAESHAAVHESLTNLIQHMISCIASSAGVLDENTSLTKIEDLEAPVTPCPTVIVVDDDPAIGIDLTATLIEEGFDVRVVQDIN